MKKTLVLFFLLLSIINFYGQNNSEGTEDVQLLEENEIIDSILEEESEEEFLKSVTKFQFIHLSIEYNNKTYFSGRDIGTDQFNISPQITYLHSNGLYFGLEGVYYDEFAPEWDYTSATIGYGKSFGKNKQYRWETSYDRYFYTNTSGNNPFKNALSFTIEVDNKKKTFGTEVATTYLFGSDNSLQIVSSTYGILNLLKKKHYHLKLQPQLNIVLAEQTIQLSQTFTIRGVQFTRYVQNNDFGLINTQLQIPLQYSTGNVDFELGYIFNFPTALEGETNLKTTGFFNFSMSYLFDL
ncbi:hypothetical protein [uncultured Tenacibaculum sp.]|uniref:hypothetical protein n=1 Tax=uncultured Tenacibaculum sp. TaxID=174713 RepID=UPI00260FF58A|nr:hypothetical protein [uncultured Tenacibaculum sp.]